MFVTGSVSNKLLQCHGILNLEESLCRIGNICLQSNWLQNDVCPVDVAAAVSFSFAAWDRKNHIEWNCFLWLCATPTIFTLHFQCQMSHVQHLLLFVMLRLWTVMTKIQRERKTKRQIESHCESRHRCYHHLWLSAAFVHLFAKIGGIYLLKRHTITSVVASCAFFRSLFWFPFPDAPRENAYQYTFNHVTTGLIYATNLIMFTIRELFHLFSNGESSISNDSSISFSVLNERLK